MKIIIILTLCLGASAASVEKLKKDGRIVIFDNEGQDLVGQELKVFTDGKVSALIEVTKCKGNRCLGKRLKRAKNNPMNLSSDVQLGELVSPRVVDSTATGANSLYVGLLGAPLNSSFKAAWRRELNQDFQYGVNFGLIFGSVSNVNIGGFSLGAEGSYKLFDFFGMQWRATAELGYAASTLDFSSVDPSGHEESVGVIYAQLGAKAVYQMGRFGLEAGGGIALNTYEDRYNNEADEPFTVPFATSLFVFDIGLSYSF